MTARRLLLPAATLALAGVWLATASVFGREALGLPWWAGPLAVMAVPSAALLVWVVVDDVRDTLAARRNAARAGQPVDLDDEAVLEALDDGWSLQAEHNIYTLGQAARAEAKRRHPAGRKLDGGQR